MAQVFISKKDRTDMPIAERLADMLERNGISCWYSPRNVRQGEPYENSIIDAIEECSVFLLVLTRHSAKSDHVARELEYLAKLNNRLNDQSRYDQRKSLLIYEADDCDANLSRQMKYLLAGANPVEAFRIGESSAMEIILAAAKEILPKPVQTSPNPAVPQMPEVPPAPAKGRTGQHRILLYGLAVVLTVMFASFLGDICSLFLEESAINSDLFNVVSLFLCFLPAKFTAQHLLSLLPQRN